MSEYHLRALLVKLLNAVYETLYSSPILNQIVENDQMIDWWKMYRDEICVVSESPLWLNTDTVCYNNMSEKDTLIHAIATIDEKTAHAVAPKRTVPTTKSDVNMAVLVPDIEDLMRFMPPCHLSTHAKLRANKHITNDELNTSVPHLVQLEYEKPVIVDYLYSHFKDEPGQRKQAREKEFASRIERTEHAMLTAKSDPDTRVFIGYGCKGLQTSAAGAKSRNSAIKAGCPFAFWEKPLLTEFLTSILTTENRKGENVDKIVEDAHTNPSDACSSFFELRYGKSSFGFGGTPQSYVRNAYKCSSN